jgi:hypothetical protein
VAAAAALAYRDRMSADRTSSSPHELAAALPPLATALDQLGIGWHLVGALALQAHGITGIVPAATLELAIGLRAAQGERLLPALAAAFDLAQPWPERPRGTLPPLQLRHRTTGAACVLHVVPDTDHDRRALQRSQRRMLPPFAAAVPIAAIEDLVLWQLRQVPSDVTASAPAPAELVELLRHHRGSWNHCYLLEWSERLGIAGPVDDLLLALRGVDAGPG